MADQSGLVISFKKIGKNGSDGGSKYEFASASEKMTCSRVESNKEAVQIVDVDN